MDISVLIVTYNSAATITRCLESLFTQTEVTMEVIVVDNASADASLERCRDFPAARVIASPENLGFGRGNNLGFAASTGRYVYLLNPDACLTSPRALADLCRAMDVNSAWGLAGTTVRSANGYDESAPSLDYPGQRWVSCDFSRLPGRIAWIIGASMVIRREVYFKLNGFDPAFFLYSEETDFCLRARKAGFEIGQVPSVVVEHIGGVSEDSDDPYARSARKMRGLIVFRHKHYSPPDCRRLARRDLRRALWRAAWNQLLARWLPPQSKAWQKSRNYQAVCEVSRQYLDTHS